jgi:hypothetical protein
MGEVVGRIPQKLIPKSMAVKIDLSGGSYRLALRQRMRQPGHIKMQSLVLDNSGNVFGAYMPSADVGVGNLAVCFTERAGYAFMTHKHNKVALTTAPLR